MRRPRSRNPDLYVHGVLDRESEDLYVLMHTYSFLCLLLVSIVVIRIIIFSSLLGLKLPSYLFIHTIQVCHLKKVVVFTCFIPMYIRNYLECL